MAKNSYHFAVCLPARNGRITAFIPDFPEIVTEGSDPSEVMELLEDSILEVLEDYAQEGRAIPAPSPLAKAKQAAEAFLDRHGREDLDGEPFFPLVAAPDVDRTPVRVSMSLPRCAIAALDAKAKLAGKTRSGYVAWMAMN